ncbi:UPF0481 protein At3g47200-like [Cucurbita moschata]|uniref:UPF0481 protein At3g47200-like n=1 Tax=Cucurbita moschata TaxID=3662 RepID=A0A6J1HF63_CUCMO|nr:UPF0481 protein At3g47200-like [Cucurbita moschata]
MELSASSNTNEISRAEIENETGTYDPVEASINRILQQSISFCSEGVTIYKVPELLRSIKPEVYMPTTISIGPLHSDRKDLGANSFKSIFLRLFLDFTQLSVNTIVETVRNLEQRARSCYAKSMEMSRDEFVELLVLDAYFVVMHLIQSTCSHLDSPKMTDFLQFNYETSRDLMLLENQLPFFLLQSLYDLVLHSKPSLNDKSFIQIVSNYFCNNDDQELLFIDINLPLAAKVDHFLDLVRIRKPCLNGDITFTSSGIFWPPNATELHKCGVIFRTGSVIKFSDQAYEQCYIGYEDKNSMSNFAAFMQFLVQTDQDVKLLIKGGIIDNNLGSVKEVTQLFNNLGKHVYPGVNYYSFYCKTMKDYCKHRCHRWMTSLRRNYFSTPWLCASSIAAIFLLALTYTNHHSYSHWIQTNFLIGIQQLMFKLGLLNLYSNYHAIFGVIENSIYLDS